MQNEKSYGQSAPLRKMDVASGPVPDVMVVIPDIAHIACTNNKACLRQFACGESPWLPSYNDNRVATMYSGLSSSQV